MEESRHTERRLAAILSADVHAYSRMMGEDEVATVREVKFCREIISSEVVEHHGRIVDAPGDNVLAEFLSAVEAVQCAVEIQHELADHNQGIEQARRMEFRIGVHLGDVISDDDKIYGDGVNIAARLEGLAQPGGICISSAVNEQIRGKLDLDCEDLGEQRVKNIARPVRVLRVRIGQASIVLAPRRPSRRRVVVTSIATLIVLAASTALYLVLENSSHPTSEALTPAAQSSNATLAVLPFANMSANKDDEYFSDGVTAEIIGDLAKIPGLQVIDRRSSFAFKGENQDVKKIARRLNVGNVLDGSVRRSGDRIRIEVELIDASNGFTVWSDRYDRKLADVFQIQSDVAESVAENLKVKLLSDERTRLESQPTSNLEAYNLFLLGNFYLLQWTPEGFAKAVGSYQRAVEKDHHFARAYAQLAYAYELSGDETMPQRESTAKGKAAAERALELDDNLGSAHGAMGMAFLNDWDWAAAEGHLKRALALDPGDAGLHEAYAEYLLTMGRNDEALRERQRSRELNPVWPAATAFIGDVYFASRQYGRALQYYQDTIQMAPDFYVGYLSRGWGLFCQGNPEKAVPDFEKAAALADSPVIEGVLGEVYGLTGRKKQALKILEHLKQRSTNQYVSAIAFTAVYGGLGDKDRAFHWLDVAYENRSGYMQSLRSPVWDGFRSDPRFQTVYKKVGLPD